MNTVHHYLIESISGDIGRHLRMRNLSVRLRCAALLHAMCVCYMRGADRRLGNLRDSAFTLAFYTNKFQLTHIQRPGTAGTYANNAVQRAPREIRRNKNHLSADVTECDSMAFNNPPRARALPDSHAIHADENDSIAFH